MSAPTISSMIPSVGPLAGGTVVTITGTYLASPTSVTFGTSAGTSISVNGAGTVLTVTSPAGTGAQTVTVTTAGGTATATFTYLSGGGLVRPRVSFSQGYGYQTTDGTVQYDERRSRATWTVRVDHVPDSENIWAAMCSGLPSAYVPTTHPDASGLQVYTITYRVIGRHKDGTVAVDLTGHYGPKVEDGVTRSTGHISLPWYTDYAGTLLPARIDGSPGMRHKRITISMYRIRYRVYSRSTPTDYTANYDTINNAGVTLGYPIPIYAGTVITNWTLQPAIVAPQDTLLFTHPVPRQILRGNTSIWIVDYIYQFRNEVNAETITGLTGKHGWWQQLPPSTAGGNPTATLMYPESSFTGLPGVSNSIPTPI